VETLRGFIRASNQPTMRYVQFLPLSLFIISCTSSPAETKSIDVTGHASVKVVPDMVELSLRAENLRPAMKDAVAQTQQDVQAIIEVCKKYVTDENDIKVSNISTNKAYDYQNGREIFTGYQAAQVLDVSLKNISRIEKFTEDLLATRISRIESVRYNHTKADSILREVNLMALDDARQTAEKMCGKMNVRLGNICYLSNFQPSGRQEGGMRSSGNGYELNLYNKSFGGRGFKMTTEILEFEDAAFARFVLN
jgi:uncharacterized protein YggE